MAVEDIRVDLGFLAHRKTFKLRNRAGDVGIVALLQLWLTAAKERPSGVLHGWGEEDVLYAARFQAVEGFIGDLVEFGWLDFMRDGELLQTPRDRAGIDKLLNELNQGGGGLVFKLHNWELRQGWVVNADVRSAAGRYAAQQKWKKINEGKQADNAGRNADRNADSCGPEKSALPLSSSSSSPKKKKTYKSHSDEVRLAEYLFQKIKTRNPEYKEPNIQTWAKYVDLMIRMDKRSPERIKQVIDYAQGHDFWYDKILSTWKLRKNFDVLLVRMDNKGPAGTTVSMSEEEFEEMVKGK